MLLCDIRYPLVYFKVKLMLLFNCKYKQLTNRQLIIPNRNCDLKMSFSKSLKDWELLVLCENSKKCRARNTIGCFWWIRTPWKNELWFMNQTFTKSNGFIGIGLIRGLICPDLFVLLVMWFLYSLMWSTLYMVEADFNHWIR